MIELLKNIQEKKELNIKINNDECRFIKNQIITLSNGKKIYTNTSKATFILLLLVIAFTTVYYFSSEEINNAIRLFYEVFLTSILVSLTMHSLSLIHSRKTENKHLILLFIEKAKPLYVDNTLDEDLRAYFEQLLYGFPDDKEKPF